MDQESTNGVFELLKMSETELRDRLRIRFDRDFRVDYSYSPKYKCSIVRVQELRGHKLMKIRIDEFAWAQRPFARLEDRIVDRMNHEDFDNGNLKGAKNNAHQKAENQRIREITEGHAGFSLKLGR